MKHIKLIDPVYPPEMSLETYPGELLSNVIARALDNGVSPEMGAPLQYDEAIESGVDPNTDIRTDRFSIAEYAEHQRSASEAMSRQANSSTVTPVDPLTPSPEPPVPTE